MTDFNFIEPITDNTYKNPRKMVKVIKEGKDDNFYYLIR